MRSSKAGFKKALSVPLLEILSPAGILVPGSRRILGSILEETLRFPPRSISLGTDLGRFGDSAPRDFLDTLVVSGWFLAFPKA